LPGSGIEKARHHGGLFIGGLPGFPGSSFACALSATGQEAVHVLETAGRFYAESLLEKTRQKLE